METLIYVNIRPYKVERIRPVYAAKNLGYRIALIADEDPGLNEGLIDDLILVNTYDIEEAAKASLRYAEDHSISGVLTWTDKDVELVAKISETLNLPGISVEAAKRARNKYLMRDALSHIEQITPKYKRVVTFNDLKEATEKIGFPGIFKPVGASGSKGIFKIEKDTNLFELYNVMIESTSPEIDKIYSYYPNEYIYEEYLDGPEVSVDGLVQNDNIYMTGVADNLVTEDYSLDYLEIFPSEKEEATVEFIKREAAKAVRALEFNHCAFHLEGRLTSTGFKIIEVAGRPGGGFLATHVFEHAADQSYLEFIIKVAVGESIKESWQDFDKSSTRSVCHYEVLAQEEGTVKDIRGLDDVLEDEEIIVTVPVRQINDEIILPPKNFETCYLATAIVKGDNFKAVQQTIDRLEKKLEYCISKE